MAPANPSSDTARLTRQLAESQALAHIGSWEWDVLTDALTWTDEHYRIWGVAPGTPVDMATLMNGIHPDDRTRVQQIINRSLQDGKAYHMEFRVVRADGTERIVEARGTVERNAAGVPLRNYGTAQDVTERRGAEDLREHLLARPGAHRHPRRLARHPGGHRPRTHRDAVRAAA